MKNQIQMYALYNRVENGVSVTQELKKKDNSQCYILTYRRVRYIIY